ncbi:membrane protein insertase YidC [Candidatus Parcubacteria bacterium]|nr:membrane protein insertase YidC [Candidatus Parcubacteria bacterium]
MFQTFLVRPLFNLLIVIYNVLPVPDLGLATILFTVLVWGVLLYPLSRKLFASQEAMSKLQPELKRLQEVHKHDRGEQAKATMTLYREHGVNPFTGCIVILVQLPIFFALFRVFSLATNPENLSLLYGFVSQPAAVHATLFGLLDLARPNAVLAVLTGLAQFVQSKLTILPLAPDARAQDFTRIMSVQTTYVFPVLIAFAALSFPAGLSLYWVTSTSLQIAQRLWAKRKSHG